MSITALGFLCLFFGSILKALAGRPIYGLYAYILTLYMYAPGSWWGASLPDLRWSLMSAVVTLMSIWIYSKPNRRDGGAKNTYDSPWYAGAVVKLYFLFVVWVWIQNLWAVGAEVHFEYSIIVTKFLLLIYLVNKAVRSLNDLLSIVVVHIIGCSFFGYIGLTQHAGGRLESVPTPGMSDGNLLSIHMVPFLIAASYVLLLDVGKKKYCLIPFIVLTLNAVFLTESRGAIVGLGCAGLLAVFFIAKKQRKLFTSLAMLALIGGLSLIGEQLLSRLNSTVGDRGEIVDKSAESRIYIAKAQFRMFKASPFFGHGHRGTLYLSPEYLDQRWLTSSEGKLVRASHNITMSILVDHGLVGLLTYFGAVLAIFYQALSHRSKIINEEKPIYIVLTGCVLGLFAVMVTSQLANSMRLEVGIWFIALCSLILQWLARGVNLDWIGKSKQVKNGKVYELE